MGRIAGSLVALMSASMLLFAIAGPATAWPQKWGDSSPGNGNSNGNGNRYAYGQDKGEGGTVVVDPAADATTTTTVVGDPGNGANQDCGAYCPSGVGLPSGNGNGNGDATGKPCAGCVGNADGKNPPGQFKDGSDHNNGYECDGNHGIGRTNPAHSGCSTTTTEPSTTTTLVPCTGPSCSTTTTTEPSTTTTVVPCTGDSCSTTTTAPGDTTTTTAPTSVLGEQFNRPSGSTSPLAFTGGAFAGMIWTALGLIGVGLALVVRRRRTAQG
jgi:hypothetical protein